MSKEEKPSVQGYFDAFAPMHDRYAAAADWPEKADRLIGKSIGLKAEGTVDAALDLGAGTGFSVDAIGRHARPSRIVAVDTSSKMLDELRKRHAPEAVETVTADIADYLAACGETFDLITAMSALEFVPDLPEVLKHVPRLLNRGGVFAATYVPQTSEKRNEIHESPDIGQALEQYYWEPEEVEGTLTSGGLVIAGRDSIPPYEEDDVRVGSYNFVVATKP